MIWTFSEVETVCIMIAMICSIIIGFMLGEAIHNLGAKKDVEKDIRDDR